jgi:large subunit ribosomal protein L25
MDRVKLVVHPRTEAGSRAARRLRRQNLIPGVLYGSGKPAVELAVDAHALREAVSTGAGRHAVLDLSFEGQKRNHIAILKDYQLDPVRHVVTHCDFQEIKLDEPIESEVDVAIEGTAEGVKMGGVLDVSQHTVLVSALPTEMPEHLTIDVDKLEIGDVARVADLVVPETVRVLTDPETVVCSVLAPRVAEVAEVEEEEAIEGEAAPTEPELVGEKGEEPETAE